MTAAGATLEPTYALTDHNGRDVTERTFRGSYQLVFFGFTHCRMVCPRELRKLTEVLNNLGEVADAIQPIYISVDPERDSTEVMRTFLERDYPKFLGLTGSKEACETARSAFRVFASRGEDPHDPEGYAVPHTALTYLLGREGQYLTHFSEVAGVDRITAHLRTLL